MHFINPVNPKRVLAATILLGMLAVPVLAHSETSAQRATTGWSAGLVHPLTGLDHVLAMVAVGLWAAQRGGRAIVLLPASFVALMLIGATLGLQGLPLPAVEAGIAASVIVLGLVVASAARWPLWAGASLAGVFAILHGHAHGHEFASGYAVSGYLSGFALTTLALHVAGIALGLGLLALRSANLLRLAGAGVACCGAGLLYLALG